MKKLALFGGGGHGKVCASIAEALGYSVSFFVEEGTYIQQSPVVFVLVCLRQAAPPTRMVESFPVFGENVV